jgi:histidine triad (HIT) family protein
MTQAGRSIFTRIIDGEIPGRIVACDEHCVAMLDIAPVSTGHTLVVPRIELDHWTDLEPELCAHLMRVAHRVARALRQLYDPPRVGLLVAGFEVAHTHLHVLPIADMSSFQLTERLAPRDPESLDVVERELRDAISGLAG